MSGYIENVSYTSYMVEEPNGEKTHYTSSGEESNEYWRFYSKQQKKRFSAVLRQLKETWYTVYGIIKFLVYNGGVTTVEKAKEFNLVRMFIVEHRAKVEYWSEEKRRIRQQKGFIKKKLDKLRKLKTKL